MPLVDRIHEQLHSVRFALLDLDDLVEVFLFVAFAGLDFAFNQLVVGRVDVLVERGLNLLHLERRQEAVVDAVLERVNVDRLAKILVGVDVVLALGRGGQTELHGRCEVFEDAAPSAFVLGTATMAFVDHDEVEEVRRILAEIELRFVSNVVISAQAGIHGLTGVCWIPACAGMTCLGSLCHEGLEDREEQIAVLQHLALLLDLRRVDPHEGIFGEGREGVEGLVGEDVAVGEEQDAWTTRRFPA